MEVDVRFKLGADFQIKWKLAPDLNPAPTSTRCKSASVREWTPTFTDTESRSPFENGRLLPPGRCRLPINEGHVHIRGHLVSYRTQFRGDLRSDRAHMWAKVFPPAFIWGALVRRGGVSHAAGTGRLLARCMQCIHRAAGCRRETAILTRDGNR